MKVKFLSNTIPWFGKYSGYEIIENYFPDQITKETTYISKAHLHYKILGKILKFYYNPEPIAASLFYKTWYYFNLGSPYVVRHILYGENFINYFPFVLSSQLNKLVVTLHLPLSQWTDDKLVKLQEIKNVILLYEKEIPHFERFLPNAKISYIPLGVDTSYFKPAEYGSRLSKSFLFLGHYLRNFNMLCKVIKQALAKDSDIVFDLVIPDWIVEKELSEIVSYEQVRLHHGISDDQLNKLYKSCTAMLMPMNDSGANTAIVQGISCGCPIITTDVGGIRNYGGGSIYPLVSNNDVEEMVEMVLNYANNSKLVKEVSINCRDFALTKLSWPIVVKQHLDLYESL